jgi:hypothetical protein
MHVTPSLPATWRGRSTSEIAARLDLEGRTQRLYQRITEGVLPGIRRQGPKLLARFHKARSATQTPSAIQRVAEEIIALFVADQTIPRIRLVVVELGRIVDELDPRGASVASVLQAIHAANAAGAEEATIESQLLTRPDRAISAADLDAFEEVTMEQIAAGQTQLLEVTRLRRHLRMARLGIGTVNGGLAS